MSFVFVIDTHQQPLNPVPAGRARMLLTQGKAAIFKRYPFKMIVKEAMETLEVAPLRIKIDPGSHTTGLAIVNDASGEVVFAAELTHRGQAIKAALEKRRAVRRSRRQRKTRYRQARFRNRRRPQGWLVPSLESRAQNVVTWVKRFQRVAPITAISQELVRFDLQQMDNPEISGCEYQQGTLAGYEVRGYLLEKWQRTCAYCGAQNVPLQIEHIQARARGGTDRISNLCLACEPCNRAKGTQDIRAFLNSKPDRLRRILAQAKGSLKDAAAVNSTRWALFQRLSALGLPVEVGTGGRTRFNRAGRELPKTRWLDAACVGQTTPPTLHTRGVVPLLMTAHGHGSRQVCLMDRFGFPRSKPKAAKKVKGFQTGDMVRAIVTTGKKQGTYLGRVRVRSSGSFDLVTSQGLLQGISHRFCTILHRCDGYSYEKGAGHCSPASAARGLLALIR